MSSRIAVCGQAPVSTGAMRSSASTAIRRSASASSVVKMSLVTTTMLTVVGQQPAQRGDQRGLAAADRATDADAQRAGAGRAERPHRVVGQAVVVPVGVAVARMMRLAGVVIRRQRASPPRWRGARRGCRRARWWSTGSSPSGVRMRGARPRRRASSSRGASRAATRVDLERIEAEQPHRRGGDRADEVMQRAQRGVDRVEAGCAGDARRARSAASARRGGTAAAPRTRPLGQARSAGRSSCRPSVRLIGAQSRRRCADRAARDRARRAASRPPQAAAANAASTGAVVSRRPSRNASRSATLSTSPRAWLASTPALCAWAPVGKRLSASSSNAASGHRSQQPSEQEVALGHRQLGDGLLLDQFAVDANGERVGIDRRSSASRRSPAGRPCRVDRVSADATRRRDRPSRSARPSSSAAWATNVRLIDAAARGAAPNIGRANTGCGVGMRRVRIAHLRPGDEAALHARRADERRRSADPTARGRPACRPRPSRSRGRGRGRPPGRSCTWRRSGERGGCRPRRRRATSHAVAS